jgi:hypothetical protein
VFAVMTIAARRLRAQKALLVLFFTLADVALVSWFLSWTNTPPALTWTNNQ